MVVFVQLTETKFDRDVKWMVRQWFLFFPFCFSSFFYDSRSDGEDGDGWENPGQLKLQISRGTVNVIRKVEGEVDKGVRFESCDGDYKEEWS